MKTILDHLEAAIKKDRKKNGAVIKTGNYRKENYTYLDLADQDQEEDRQLLRDKRFSK